MSYNLNETFDCGTKKILKNLEYLLKYCLEFQIALKIMKNPDNCLLKDHWVLLGPKMSILPLEAFHRRLKI